MKEKWEPTMKPIQIDWNDIEQRELMIGHVRVAGLGSLLESVSKIPESIKAVSKNRVKDADNIEMIALSQIYEMGWKEAWLKTRELFPQTLGHNITVDFRKGLIEEREPESGDDIPPKTMEEARAMLEAEKSDAECHCPACQAREAAKESGMADFDGTPEDFNRFLEGMKGPGGIDKVAELLKILTGASEVKVMKVEKDDPDFNEMLKKHGQEVKEPTYH